MSLENQTTVGLAGLLSIRLRAVGVLGRLPADLGSFGIFPGFRAASAGRFCALTEMTYFRPNAGMALPQGANVW